jgi:signal-transduction protein with cAMP-binding, CBS, and nucleotidyltransferase domain
VHRMLMGNLLSLVVVDDGRSLGILRMIDIFNEACSAIKLSEV